MTAKQREPLSIAGLVLLSVSFHYSRFLSKVSLAHTELFFFLFSPLGRHNSKLDSMLAYCDFFIVVYDDQFCEVSVRTNWSQQKFSWNLVFQCLKGVGKLTLTWRLVCCVCFHFAFVSYWIQRNPGKSDVETSLKRKLSTWSFQVDTLLSTDFSSIG